MPRTRGRLSLLALGLVFATAACASPGDPPETPPALVPLSTPAVLNWATASITLPLDAFAMSGPEIQIVLAAQSTLVWQCALGTTELTPPAAESVTAWLTYEPRASYWLDGLWDAPYVAQKGIVPPRFPTIGPASDSPAAGQALSRNCGDTPELRDLEVIDRLIMQGDQSSVTLPLMFYADHARADTHADPRWVALMEERAQCVQSHGYATEDDGLGSLKHDPSWSQEQTLAAYITMATCSDDLGTAQKAADIQAAHEQVYIQAHQAELLETRHIAEERVATATTILQDAGII